MSPDGVSTGYRITNNVIHTATALSVHASGRHAQRVGHPQRVPQRPDPRLRRQSEPGQPEHGRARQRGRHRRVGVLGLHHRSQPDRHLHRRQRPLRLRHRLAQGHRHRRHRHRPEQLRRHPAPPPPPPPSDTTRARHQHHLGPDRHDERQHADVRLHRDRGELGLRVPRRLRRLGRLHQPVDDRRPRATAPTRVSVRATDVAGNTDASPATRSFTVGTAPPPDTTAPDTTITSGPTGTTSDNTPTFAFTATEANSVFECRVDTGAWADCTSPWTTAALSDGDHSVSVRATDVAGNTDATPATRSFTVNTATPPPRTPRRPTRPSRSGQTGTTSATTASFAFTASESGSTFECKLDTARLGDLHEPQGLQRSDDRLAHLQRARHRRRGQHRQHAGDADLDDPERAGRPPAGRRLHLHPGLADDRPGRLVRRLQRDVRRHAVHLHLGGRRR